MGVVSRWRASGLLVAAAMSSTIVLASCSSMASCQNPDPLAQHSCRSRIAGQQATAKVLLGVGLGYGIGALQKDPNKGLAVGLAVAAVVSAEALATYFLTMANNDALLAQELLVADLRRAADFNRIKYQQTYEELRTAVSMEQQNPSPANKKKVKALKDAAVADTKKRRDLSKSYDEASTQLLRVTRSDQAERLHRLQQFDNELYVRDADNALRRYETVDA